MAAPTSLDDAREAARVLGASAPVGAEDVPVDACAGRVATADVHAPHALPRFASSAMDGYAVRSADLVGATPASPVALRPAGESRAGRPAEVDVGSGTAMRISTGARIPAGADAVVRVEETATGDAGTILVGTAAGPGRDVRRAGEDVPEGTAVVRTGEVLRPGHVALLAGLGIATVPCRTRPRVLLVITGDEVVAAGGSLSEGRIHDVGGPALVALLHASGARVVGLRHVGDDPEATGAALARADADLVVTCGGMSVGSHDHVRAALTRLGADERVGGLALQPGRPTWLGALPTADAPRPVLALPGNPGAAITVATILLPPLLGAMAGRAPAPPLRARLTAPTHGDARRVRALRVAIGEDDEGRRTARVLEGQQPHRLASFPATDAYALIPAADGDLPAGTAVELVLVPGGPGG